MLSIKDFVAIHKYSYEFFKLNLNLKKNFDTSLFFDRKKSMRMFINGTIVSPNLFNIYYLITLIRQGSIITAHTDKKLEDYVSFSRASFTPLVRSWCDWCSITNGYVSFLIEAMNDYLSNELNSGRISKIRLIKYNAIIHLSYLKIMLPHDKYFSHKQPLNPANLFPGFEQIHSPQLKKVLSTITRTYNTLQEVEYRWCPFQYMKRIALLAHADPDRYNYYLNCEGYADLIQAGEIISNFEQLKCSQCAEQINMYLDNAQRFEFKSKLELRTEEFFAFLCKLSRYR